MEEQEGLQIKLAQNMTGIPRSFAKVGKGNGRKMVVYALQME